MAGNRFYLGGFIFILVAIIIWASYGMLNVGKSEESSAVSVIVDDSNSDRWIALRQGLEQAARDYNIDLNYVSTGKISGVEEEMALIRRELDNGAKGIIVQLVSSVDADALSDISAKAALILLETDVTPEDLYAFAGPDNLEIGRAMAKAVRQELGDELAAKRIGVLCGNQKQLAMQQRLQGLQEGLGVESADFAWMLEREDTQTELQLPGGSGSADIIIALADNETEKMADYLQSEERAGAACVLYGVGCSEKAVYYLDKGVIKTLIVPNEFNMGYQSMEAMANQLKYHLAKAENSQVHFLVIDRTNLYDDANQKVLFPIVQ